MLAVRDVVACSRGSFGGWVVGDVAAAVVVDGRVDCRFGRGHQRGRGWVFVGKIGLRRTLGIYLLQSCDGQRTIVKYSEDNM